MLARNRKWSTETVEDYRARVGLVESAIAEAEMRNLLRVQIPAARDAVNVARRDQEQAGDRLRRARNELNDLWTDHDELRYRMDADRGVPC